MTRPFFQDELLLARMKEVASMSLPVTRPETREMRQQILDAICDDFGYDADFRASASVEKAVASFALASMRDAIAEVAQRALNSPEPITFADGKIQIESLGEVGQMKTQFLISEVGKPGAYLWEVAFRKQFTEEAEARLEEIRQLQTKEKEALGIGLLQYIMMSMHKEKRTELQQAEESLRAAPSSYKSALGAREIQSLTIQAIISSVTSPAGIGLHGCPEAVERDYNAAELPKEPKAFTDGYDPTLVIENISMNKGMTRHGDEPTFDTATLGRGLLVPPLRMMSDAIASESDLARSCKLNADLISSQECVTYGLNALKEELAIAAVWADSGLVGENTAKTMIQMHCRIWAHSLERSIDELENAAFLLSEKGHTSFECRFNCNDLRDQVWANVADDGFVIRAYNDHTAYKLSGWMKNGVRHVTLETTTRPSVSADMKEDIATLMDKAPVRRRLSFTTGESGLRLDEHEATYNLRELLDINGSLLSLSSITCCVEEEYGYEPDDGMEP